MELHVPLTKLTLTTNTLVDIGGAVMWIDCVSIASGAYSWEVVNNILSFITAS